jgi:hypothetical protein
MGGAFVLASEDAFWFGLVWICLIGGCLWELLTEKKFNDGKY